MDLAYLIFLLVNSFIWTDSVIGRLPPENKNESWIYGRCPILYLENTCEPRATPIKYEAR